MQDVKSKVGRHSVHFRISQVLSDLMDVYEAITAVPSRRSLRWMQFVLLAPQFWSVFWKHSSAQPPQETLSKDDMTKKDHRDVQTRLIPASTPLHLHTSFNCTLLKKKRSRYQPQKR